MGVTRKEKYTVLQRVSFGQLSKGAIEGTGSRRQKKANLSALDWLLKREYVVADGETITITAQGTKVLKSWDSGTQLH